MTSKELLTRAREVQLVLKQRHHLVVCSAVIKKASIQTQENFTVVTLNNNIVGVSKRHPKDSNNPITGINTALARAVHSFLQIPVNSKYANE